MLKTQNITNNTCHYCINILPQKPFIAIKEVNIVREGIEMDVEAEYKFCSGKCKKEWLDSLRTTLKN